MNTFTLVHVLISVVGIVAGFVVLADLIGNRLQPVWTRLFLLPTILTSATGFFFPFHGITPAIVVGALSLVVLAGALFALYVRRLAGIWRAVYVVTATFALYLNFFVLLAQFFQKFPAFRALAPTGSEPPFAVVQGLALLTFLFLGRLALKRFHPAPAAA